MARAKKTKFDLIKSVRQSTQASGVPFYVADKDTLRQAARLVRSILSK
jgi:diaminopimelate decarboxylase